MTEYVLDISKEVTVPSETIQEVVHVYVTGGEAHLIEGHPLRFSNLSIVVDIERILFWNVVEVVLAH